ncbi:TonB-dependent receptor domain-containing protein [Parasphingorhabdus sp. DH2-15]|uniref:TonB-dependent receptor domain-containing protein n=1 Tax=Parasphingorhabdus sp. DH2-15 TaxID=3444112 RepID=UPI003F686556
MKKMRSGSHLQKASSLIGSSVLAMSAMLMAGTAHAQDVTPDEEDEALEDAIVVTGSRIARDPNLGSPAPVLTVTGEQIQRSGGSDIGDVLRDIPALSVSGSVEDSIQGGAGSIGQSTLNLRGLGSVRTLVLVNGRRHVSGVAGSQIVDVNSIPTALIESVETITGGASAVYGADAVSGVVNFKLKDDFEGIAGNIQTGISSRGDGWRINGDLTWGTNFADGRGNFVISAEYARVDELQFGERSFSRNNGIFDDQANPALRFQAGDIGADTPNFAGSQIGSLIPTTATGFTPTAAEQALIDRAINSPRRFIATDPRFSLSSAGGVIAPGNIGPSDGPDINGNGIPDCLESFVGFNSTFNPGAFGLAGGCAVIGANGGLSVFQDGLITGTFNQFGGDGIPNNFDSNSLIPETERWSVNANFRYEFSEAAEFFFEGKYVSSNAESQSQPNTFYDLLTIRSDNPFITPDLQQFVEPLFFGNGVDEGFYITRDPADLGPNRDRNEFETYRLVGGLRGDINENTKYEVSFNYGNFQQTNFNANSVITDRFFAAIDVTTDPLTGQPICRSDIDATPPATTPFNIPAAEQGFFTFNPGDGQCAPANILGGVGAISQAAIDFITTTTVNRFELEQFVINALLIGDTGKFLNLPGGAVDYVLGVEFREETSTSRFDPLVLGVAPVSTAQINQGQLISTLANPLIGTADNPPVSIQNSLVFDPATQISNAGGQFDVFEFFGEISLPILRDVAGAEVLELSGAARFASYSTAGNAFTWNVNGLYKPVEDILFRGTYARAVRAPNINELFNPAQGAFFRPIDPCEVASIQTATDPALRQANCEAFFAQIGFTPPVDANGDFAFVDPLTARFSGSVSGNPDLDVETATTWTIGTQITPSFLPGFTLSVDYYNIEIEDAISTISAQDIVDNCVDSSSINNQFCPLVQRNPATGGFTFISQTAVNFARQETAGIEFSANYSFNLGDHGFNARVNGTWVDKLDFFFDPADPNLVDPELRELRRPEWAGNAALTWTWNDLSVTWQTTYRDAQGLAAVEVEDTGNTGADQFSFENGFASDSFIHDIAFGYDLNDKFEFYGGVNNIFDRQPFVTQQAFPVSPIGTFFYLGARVTY